MHEGDPAVPRVLSMVTVLLFHAIGAPGPYTVPASVFRQDLLYLRRQHIHVLSLQEFEAYASGARQIRTPSVLLTFDDGNITVFTRATPILRSLHMKAVAFLIGRRIGRAKDTVTAKDVKAMEASGVWSFGAHTYDLHDLMGGKPAMAYLYRHHRLAPALRRDMALETATFARLGLPRPTAFAYPFGFHNRETNRILHRDYRFLFTSAEGFVRPGERLIPRVNIGIGFGSRGRLIGYVSAMERFWAAAEFPGRGRRATDVHPRQLARDSRERVS